MDIVVSGRHCEVSDRFRAHVEEKLARLEKHDHRLIRVEVQVEKEQARLARQAERAAAKEAHAKAREPYEELTKAELSDQLAERGLPKSGTVDELIERLVSADSE